MLSSGQTALFCDKANISLILAPRRRLLPKGLFHFPCLEFTLHQVMRDRMTGRITRRRVIDLVVMSEVWLMPSGSLRQQMACGRRVTLCQRERERKRKDLWTLDTERATRWL